VKLLRTKHEPAGAADVGGKAAGLYRLLALGLPVPDFAVLTTEAFRLACPEDAIPAALPGEVEAALDDAWAALGAGRTPLAVRSSAAEEDAAQHSYAGQMETFLNVASRGALSEAVLGCWRSLYGERAVAYRARANAASRPAMAVVVQHMVVPEASGVLFTVNPSSRRPDEILVSSVWGLGEGLVSGALDADTFVLGRDGTVASRRIAEKTERFAPAPGGGTHRAAVPPEGVHAASLADATLRELARLSLQVEAAAGGPLDIEFAVADGRVVFLQARPITGLAPRTGAKQVWDNSNIIESYPGITLPLTFSFIRMAYRAVYWQFCQVLGLSRKEILRHDEMLWNMLGLIHGRVYYNLLNWYRLVALLPGFRWNKGFMEGMMGLHDAEAAEEAPIAWWRRYLVELPRLLRVGVRAALLHRSLPRRIRQFHRSFDEVHGRFSTLDFAALSAREALDKFRELEEQVLWHWKAPIINDFEAMVFYGMLKKLTVAWGVDPDGSLQNALICGQGDIESTQVAEQLAALAGLIAADAPVAERVRALPPSEALDLIRQHPQAGPAFERYLQHFGDRCIGELKLESVPMRDDPTFCVAVIQEHLRRPPERRDGSHARQNATRQDAERQIAQRLAGLGFFRRTLYRWVLRCARAAVRNRENQRLARTRAYALVRSIFRSIGRHFAEGRVLDAPEDIFYLELEEVRAFVRGDSTTDLQTLASARREEYRRYRAMPPLPDHFVTYGAGEPELPEPDSHAAGKGTVLSGLGACPGVVEAPAVVLLEPDGSAKLDRRILVARQTDPGWVVLFPAISGLVVERGSMLSHSAIVAREMGIPAVIGVRGAAERLHTGDPLRLDGAKGTVEIVAEGGL